jgi:hypothetical protein
MVVERVGSRDTAGKSEPNLAGALPSVGLPAIRQPDDPVLPADAEASSSGNDRPI